LFKINHDVFVPHQVLLELDKLKSGNATANFNARKAIHLIWELVKRQPMETLKDGIPIAPPGSSAKKIKKALTKVFFNIPSTKEIEERLSPTNPDQAILLEILERKKTLGNKKQKLVSRDIMMLIMARFAGIYSEELEEDMLDEEVLSSMGWYKMPHSFWEQQVHLHNRPIKPHDVLTLRGKDPILVKSVINEFLFIDTGWKSGPLQVRILEKPTPTTAQVQVLENYLNGTERVFGLHAWNMVQNALINASMTEGINAIIAEGVAGSGKDICVLAACLKLIVTQACYDGLKVTRDPIAAAENLGFMPGTKDEKLAPWLGGVWDNLAQIARIHLRRHKDASATRQDAQSEDTTEQRRQMRKRLKDEVQKKVKEYSKYVEMLELHACRGRSIHREIMILDEAQNESPEVIKMFVTRAAEETKVFILGNYLQSDLDSRKRAPSGLARAIQVLRGRPDTVCLTLNENVRSELSRYVEANL